MAKCSAATVLFFFLTMAASLNLATLADAAAKDKLPGTAADQRPSKDSGHSTVAGVGGARSPAKSPSPDDQSSPEQRRCGWHLHNKYRCMGPYVNSAELAKKPATAHCCARAREEDDLTKRCIQLLLAGEDKILRELKNLISSYCGSVAEPQQASYRIPEVPTSAGSH